MNYFEPQFWDNERRLLGEAFTDLTMRILLSGADNGLGDLPAETAVYMDWDVFNEAALDWMHGYLGSGNAQGVPVSSGAFQWAQNLTNTTRNRVVREIDTWIRDGDALPVLEARLTPLFGERRARNVAVTEVTRVYAAGNLMSWKSTGLVSGKRWMTAVDERVCPICGPLHNTITGVDDTWQFTREMIEANPQLVRIMKQPQAIMLPPAHVLCRCWLQPVIFEAYDPDELAEQFFNNVSATT